MLWVKSHGRPVPGESAETSVFAADMIGLLPERGRRALSFMKITLSYTGYLKFEGAKSGSIIDVEEGSTVGDVLSGFAVPSEQHRFLRLFVNDESVDPMHLLSDGDELLAIIQIGGG